MWLYSISLVRARFQALDNGFGLREAPLADQPAGGFGKARHEIGDDKTRHGAQDEKHVPAIDGNELGTQYRSGKKPNRKDQFVHHKEATASMGARQLVYVGCCDRHLTADADR